LIYQGFRVMPYSTGCTTPLSNFEAGQNYKDVNDPAVIVSFPLDSDPGVSMVAWTTTPWTLPSNLALCVHPDLMYVKVKDNRKDRNGVVYIMMEVRISELRAVPDGGGLHYPEQDERKRIGGSHLSASLPLL